MKFSSYINKINNIFIFIFKKKRIDKTEKKIFKQTKNQIQYVKQSRRSRQRKRHRWWRYGRVITRTRI